VKNFGRKGRHGRDARGRTAEMIAAGSEAKARVRLSANSTRHEMKEFLVVAKSKRTKLQTPTGAIVRVVTDEEAAHEFVPASEPEARAAGECKYCDRPRDDRIHSGRSQRQFH
jgi:hypothetical protein